jgi:putative ABC transport system substrate-binding protein
MKTYLMILIIAVLLLVSYPASAQQQGKIPRIGFMHGGSKHDLADDAFRQGIRQFGYLEGKNIFVEYRYAEGKLGRFPDFAAELVRIPVDIIVAVNDPGTRAAKNATKTIPIVMVGVGTDPVEVGLVESLARPGGNVTGVTLFAVNTAAKRLELFKEAVPKLLNVGVFYDPKNRGNVLEAKEVETAAATLGLNVRSWELRAADEFDEVFAALSRKRPDGLYVPGGPLMNTNIKRFADFALSGRLPLAGVRREAVDAGALMSYGVDTVDHYGRAAYFVDKVLKGAKPAELPVERPKKFELLFNLKTAKRIGLTIPPNVLARADKVIK